MTDHVLHLKKGPIKKGHAHPAGGSEHDRLKTGGSAHGPRPAPQARPKTAQRSVAPSAAASSSVREADGAATRAAAALCVAGVENGRSLSDELPAQVRNLDPRDKAFVQSMVFGVLRHKRLLGATLHRLLEHKLEKRNDRARALLLVGLYQLSSMRVPPHAAVAATVGASKLCGCAPLAGLINAVLRRFIREGALLAEPASEAERYSFPDWLHNSLIADYGVSETAQIMARSNEQAPMWLRVENSRLSTADYLKRLDEAGLQYETTPLCAGAVKLKEPVNVPQLPGFAAGLVSVQDLASQLAAPLLAEGLDAESSCRLLDACAAPGGKSSHLLDLLPQAQLTCADVEPERVKRLEEQLQRLQRHAQVLCADLSDVSVLPGQTFARILLDAPCSGSGVIRRHPDIKWLRRQSDLPVLVENQRALLEAAALRLETGGVLLYTTCSVFPQENLKQIEWLLHTHPEFEPWPFVLGQSKSYAVQRLPGQDEGDGFFYARLRKRG